MPQARRCTWFATPTTIRTTCSSALYRATESERLAEFLDHVDVAVSLHGYGRIGRSTQLLAGGRNRALAEHLARHVAVPGYQVVTDLDAIPRELRGLHPDNPVNRVRGGGAQLELTPAGARHQPAQPAARRRRPVPRHLRVGAGPRRDRAVLGTTLGLVRIAVIAALLVLGLTAAPAHAQPVAIDDVLTRIVDDEDLAGGSPWFATAPTSPAPRPGTPTSTPRPAFAPNTHRPRRQHHENLCGGDDSAARRRGQGRPRRADRDLSARPHPRRGHRRQRDHGASAAAPSKRLTGVLRRSHPAARRPHHGRPAARHGADPACAVRAGHGDEVHEHQLHHRRAC